MLNRLLGHCVRLPGNRHQWLSQLADASGVSGYVDPGTMCAQKVGLLRVAVCPRKQTCEGSVGRRGPARQYGQTATKLQHAGSNRRFRRSTGNREIAQGAKCCEQYSYLFQTPTNAPALQAVGENLGRKLAQATGFSHVSGLRRPTQDHSYTSRRSSQQATRGASVPTVPTVPTEKG